ncbi:MAG TPA: flagellar hook-associated protein FlgL [Stellaceae bacterium]|jgi:flagellar hook-associated protein 3 FlgL
MIRISTNEFMTGTLADILAQETSVNQLNQEIASGQTMQSAVDDPAGAGLALSTAGQIQQLSFDTANAQSGAATIQNSLASLQGINTLLSQIQSVAVQAANGTMNASDRAALAGTVNSALQQLIQLANTQSADGSYIFAGSKSAAAPFVVQTNGRIAFNGDADTTSVTIAPSLSVPVSMSGQNIFMNIPSGNGSFSASASGGNTGTAYVTPAAVTNASQVLAEHLANTQFVVTFGAVSPTGSQTYTVTSGTGSPGTSGFAATSGVVTSGSFASGAGLNLGGMNLNVGGTPASGDKFVVATSQNTDIFTIVQNLATALSATANKNDAQQLIENAMAELGTAQTTVLGAQATLGGNLSDIQSVQSLDENASTTQKAQLSSLQTANLPQVITNYNEGVIALQAAEAAFARIQNLNLFQMIGH